jgi:hypothetical protein
MNPLSKSAPLSLNVQIRNAENRLLNRRRKVRNQTGTLIHEVKNQLFTPATLLLGGCCGFILGELSRFPWARTPADSQAAQTSASSRLSEWANLFTIGYTLYKALPIAWIEKCVHPDDSPDRNATAP